MTFSAKMALRPFARTTCAQLKPHTESVNGPKPQAMKKAPSAETQKRHKQTSRVRHVLVFSHRWRSLAARPTHVIEANES